jgi:putative flippase GtrA
MAQEVKVLESVKRPQVLPQDVSTSHDFLGQDTQVFQAHEKEGSSRVSCFFDKIVLSVFIDMNVCLISSTQFFSYLVDNCFMKNSIIILEQACPGGEHKNKDKRRRKCPG